MHVIYKIIYISLYSKKNVNNSYIILYHNQKRVYKFTQIQYFKLSLQSFSKNKQFEPNN